ncbi:MAG: RrF2 family transcriptional regulator [Lachnospiraceae bacterium]|nr:RrF2 family transcriptional regulator [Lachnospiraceae bacterium]
MMISTKGRYALRVMIDLAEQQRAEYVPLKEIAARQEISQKYLESIMVILSKNNFIEALHGKGGGYRLNREPKDYKVGDILRLTEGTLAPVACLGDDAKPCEKTAECRTLPVWENLYNLIINYLDSVTIADLVKNELPDNYVI